MTLSAGTVSIGVKSNTSGFGANLHNSLLGQIGGIGASLGKTIVAGAAVGVTALGGMAAAGVFMGVKVAAGNEQAMIGFTTMLGSAKKASAFLKDLQVFAAKTPFEFPELQSAASSLISVGVKAKDVIPIMTTLGNATSGMGTGADGVKRATIAIQQMIASGKIQGQDLAQLRDAGIPVYDLLATATGKSTAKIAELANAGKLGKKELDQMMAALSSGKGLERFNGLMDKQSTSLVGLWSTLKDTVGQGLATAITPLVPMIKNGLGGAITFLTDLMPKLAAGFKGTVEFFTGTVVPGVKALTAAFVAGGDDVTSSGFAGIMERIGLAARKIADFVMTKVVPAIKGFIEGFQDGTGAGGKFRDIVQGVASFVGDKLIPAVKEVAEKVFPIFRDIIASVAGFFTDKLIPAVRKVYETVLPALMGLFRSVTKTMQDHQGVIDFVKTAFSILGDLVVNILLPALGNIAKFILTVLGPVFRGLITIVEDVVIPGVKILVKVVLGIIGAILDGAAKAFGWIPGLGDKLQSASSAFDAFRDRTNAALSGIKPPAPITVHAQMVWDSASHSLVPVVGGSSPGSAALPRPGSAAAKGGTSITVGTVVAHDYKDFTSQMNNKSRLAALGLQ